MGIMFSYVQINLRAALLAAAAGLLAAVGLVVVLYAQPAEANYPGKPGKIAYAGYDGNDSDIYTIQPNGGGRLNVTDNSSDDYYPSYSPSGKKIAYVNDAGGDGEIWTIKPNGVAGSKSPTTLITTKILTGGANSDCSLRVAPEE
jgi:hypothetical protein